MADTNLGDLFFTLGLKEDEFEKTNHLDVVS